MIFIFALVPAVAWADGPERRFRWRHNESKEDPIQRRNFKVFDAVFF